MAIELNSVLFGPSKSGAVTSFAIPNPRGRGWLTIENRLALPLLATPTPAGSGASLAMSLGQHVPRLSKVCIPIDPDGDVELSCLAGKARVGMRAWDGANIFSVISTGTVIGRTIPYMLHDEGAPHQAPLYPTPMPLGGQFLNVAVGQAQVLYIDPTGLNPAPAFETALLGSAANPVQEAVLLAATVNVEGAGLTDAGNLAIYPAYDYDAANVRHTAFGGPLFPFAGGGSAAGASCTFACPGAIGIAFQNQDVATAQLAVSAWVGIPAQ